MKKFASKIVKKQISRISDPWGKGHFGASRGHRSHKGLDVQVSSGEAIFSPISGVIRREAIPYANDPRYSGLLIKGTNEWAGIEIKMFYVKGIVMGNVWAGQHIGYAQNLQLKYPGITNHVHIEAKKMGSQINPFELWRMCF